MSTQSFTDYTDIFESLIELHKEGKEIYLIGGAVRDALRNKNSNDLDFITDGKVRTISKKIANVYNGAYFILDDERETCRIIIQRPGGKRLTLDIARMQHGKLENDLQSRDFTVNAIAFNLETKRLIDPLGGANDLHHKRLIACSPDSMRDDPIRIMRGVRLSMELKSKIESETKEAMRVSAPLLKFTSVERQRDELFRILDGYNISSAIRILGKLNVLDVVTPELIQKKDIQLDYPVRTNLWEHSIRSVYELEAIINVIVGKRNNRCGENIRYGLIVLQLGPFRHLLGEHYKKILNPHRSLKALIMFASLYLGVGKTRSSRFFETGSSQISEQDEFGSQIIEQRSKELALSQREIHRLMTIIHNLPLFDALAERVMEKKPTRREIYKFFEKTGEAGIDICLISLATHLSKYGTFIDEDEWASKLELCQHLFDSWWHKNELLNPHRLLTGNDIKQHFNIDEGPIIGTLLKRLREEQAAGEINTRSDALSFVNDILYTDSTLVD